MKNRFSLFAAILLLTLASWSGAATLDLAQFKETAQQLESYRFGGGKPNQNGLVYLESQVAMASQDAALRPQVEAILISTLERCQTLDARQFLCRLLRTIGTEKSVPALEAFLTDPEMSHMARYALGQMESPAAGDALLRALSQVSGDLQAGLINTLAQCHFAAAAPEVARLIDSSDVNVSIAAVKATGQFGGPEAVERLQQAREDASERLQREIDNALLVCAETAIENGQPRVAGKIYRTFYFGPYSEPLRVAGLRGMVAVRGKTTTPLLVRAIQGEDPDLRRHAINLLAQIPGENIMSLMTKLYWELPSDVQVLIIRIMAERGDPAALPTIVYALRAASGSIRLAACEALGVIGDATSLPPLAQAAAVATGREKEVARASLVSLRGNGMDEAFIQALALENPEVRTEIIRALGQRGSHSALAPLMEIAREAEDPSVRHEAILSAGRVAKAEDLDALVSLAVTPKEAGDRDTFEKAISLVFARVDSPEKQAVPVLAALENAPVEAQPTLLRLLSQPATAEGLAAVRSALQSSDKLVSDAAIRTLGDWPNADPAEDLFVVASQSENTTHQILALRSYVQMAKLSKNPTEMYVKAMKLAERPDEIRRVLGGLGNANTLVALELAESYLGREEFKAEATRAALQVADQYGWQDPERARKTLDRIIAESDNDSLRDQARRSMDQKRQFVGHIFVWRGTGPYRIAGVNEGAQVFNTPFAPEEDPDDASIRWIPVIPKVNGNRLDLESTFGRVDYCSAYVRTKILSPKNQELRVEWGADDFIKGWINGKPVRDNKIPLHEGANEFMLKVGDHGGGWLFNCRLFKADGSPADDLKFIAD